MKNLKNMSVLVLAQLVSMLSQASYDGESDTQKPGHTSLVHFKGAITCAPVQLFQCKEGSGNSFDGVVEAIKLGISQAKKVLHSVGTRRKLLLESQL